MLNTIITIKNTIENRVFKIKNHKGEPFIIYVKNNHVFLPSCFESQMISIPKQVEFGTDCADFIKVYEKNSEHGTASYERSIYLELANAGG